MDTFNRIMLLVTKLTVSADGSKIMAEKFTLLNWFVQSPDLNIIQNLWDGIKRGIAQLETVSSYLKESESTVYQMWSQFPGTTC